MGTFSALHWVIVGIIFILLFGARRLPEVGSGLGKAINNFRKAYKEGSAIDVTPEEKDKKDPPPNA